MTTNPTQAQKYLWLGLSRTLQTVDDDDIPNDAIVINSLTLTEQSLSNTILTEAELENTISEEVSTTITYTLDGFRIASQTETFSATETKTITKTLFPFIILGNIEVTISVGNNQQTETILLQ